MKNKQQKIGYVLLIIVVSILFNVVFDGLIIPMVLSVLTGISIILLIDDAENTRKDRNDAAD